MAAATETRPYGQHDGHTYHSCNPRGSDWGEQETALEWPPNSTVVVSSSNEYYDAPPPHGKKFMRETLIIPHGPHVIVESRFIPEFRHSRWVSVSFKVAGILVWTNVVRDPISQRVHRSPDHYVNWHTQWGYRMMGQDSHTGCSC